MLHSLITIAKVEVEVAQADPPPTTGEIIVGLLTLTAFVLSCMTLARCFRRWQRGQIVMPVAKREPLHVPIPLAILGVVVATTLAAAATLQSFDDFMAEPTASAEVDTVEVDGIEVDTVEVDGIEVNGVEVAPAQPNQAKDSSIDHSTVAPSEAAEPEEPSVTSDETSDKSMLDKTTLQGDAKNVTEQRVRRKALRTIDGTLQMMGLLLLLFGSAVWLVQADGPGRAFQGNNSTTANSRNDLPAEADERVSEHQIPQSDFAATVPAATVPAATVPVIAAVQEPWNLFVELKFASMAFLMALVPTFAARLTMLSFMEQPKSHEFITMIKSGALSVQLVVPLLLIATIVAPVVEELLYRVVVLGGIKNRRAPWVAVVVSSILFGFAHGFPDCISLLPLAFVLGYTYTQRRSYRTVMLVHLIFNGFNMVLLLIQLLVTN